MDWFFENKCFYPDDYQKTIFDIDFQEWRLKGIQVIMMDLDNTLISYDETEPNDKIAELFEKIRSLGMDLVIISNNHFPRVKHFADMLSTPFVSGAKKPLKFGFKRALRFFPEAIDAEVLVVGDQFMTDVLGAKRMGFSVIVVDAIKRKAEKWFTRINRRMEKRVLKRMKKHNYPFYQRLHLDEKR